MIDEEGKELYNRLLEAIDEEADIVTQPVAKAMDAFDNHMNIINQTRGAQYTKNGDILFYAEEIEPGVDE